MNLNEIKVHLKQELSFDNLETLISLKRNISVSSVLYDEVVLQESRLRQVKKDFQLNIISREDKDLVFDKIRYSTLEIINRIRKKDVVDFETGGLSFLKEIERENRLYLENKRKLNETLSWWKEKITYLDFEHTTFETEDLSGETFITTEKSEYKNFKLNSYGSIVNISYEINQIASNIHLKTTYDRYVEVEFNLKDIFDLRIEEKIEERNYFDKIFHLEFNSVYGRRCFKIMEVIKKDIMYIENDIVDETPPLDQNFSLTNKLIIETKNKVMADKFVNSIMAVANLFNEKIDLDIIS